MDREDKIIRITKKLREMSAIFFDNEAMADFYLTTDSSSKKFKIFSLSLQVASLSAGVGSLHFAEEEEIIEFEETLAELEQKVEEITKELEENE